MLDFGANIGSSLVANEISGKTEEYHVHDCPACGNRYSMHTDMHKLVHLLVEMRDSILPGTTDKPVDERITLQPGTLVDLHTYGKNYTMLFSPVSAPIIFQVMGVGTATLLTLGAGWNVVNLPDGTQFGLPVTAPGNVSVLLRASNALYGEMINDSLANPNVTEGIVSNAVRNGQSFIASGSGVTGLAAISNCALSLFNPAGSGKMLLLYSWRVLTGSNGGTLSYWGYTTTDPAGTTGFTLPVTPVHQPGINAPACVASCSRSPSGNAATVSIATRTEEFLPASGVSYELIAASSVLEIPPGYGVAAIMYVSTIGNYFQSCAKWVEV